MGNPLYDMMGGNPLVQQFLDFQKNFTGDAQAQVQQLLNSGRVSQSQYNEAVQKAQALQQLLASSVRR